MTPTAMGHDDGEQTGDDHLAERALRADVHAAGVLSAHAFLTLAQTGDLIELPPHFLDHVLCGAAHGLHRESTEYERHQCADQQANERGDFEQVDCDRGRRPWRRQP